MVGVLCHERAWQRLAQRREAILRRVAVAQRAACGIGKAQGLAFAQGRAGLVCRSGHAARQQGLQRGREVVARAARAVLQGQVAALAVLRAGVMHILRGGQGGDGAAIGQEKFDEAAFFATFFAAFFLTASGGALGQQQPDFLRLPAFRQCSHGGVAHGYGLAQGCQRQQADCALHVGHRLQA